MSLSVSFQNALKNKAELLIPFGMPLTVCVIYLVWLEQEALARISASVFLCMGMSLLEIL